MPSGRERVNEVLKRLGSDYQAVHGEPIDYAFAALFEAIEKKFKKLEKELRSASR